MSAGAKTLYLVDAHAYLHRAYHALPPLTTKSGEPVGALFGFARMLQSLRRERKPDFLAVCFDTPEKTFRHKEFPEYKANRVEIDEDLIRQLAGAEELVKAMGIPSAAAPGYEADDLLATLARRGVEAGLKVFLVTGDKDALQLVDKNVLVWNEAKQLELDADGVRGKFSVSPEQIVDYLALVGDSSDNVPGVPGIGAVGAAKLLGEFGSLEKLLKAAHKGVGELKEKTARALVENEEKVLKSRSLIVLQDAVPVDLDPVKCRVEITDPSAAAKVFERFEFQSLAKELLGTSIPEPRPRSDSVVSLPALKIREIAPEALLKECRLAARISVSVSIAAQPDLLSGDAPTAALALDDGRGAVFSGAAFAAHRSELAAILGGKKPLKSGHDLKTMRRILALEGISLEGLGDDSFLAAYCLDPSRGRYELEALAEAAGLAVDAKQPLGRAVLGGALAQRLRSELAVKELGELYESRELPMIPVLSDMEARGVFVDAPYLKKLRVEFEAGIASLEKEINRLAGKEINLRSPKQLAELFYDDLGLPVVHKTAKGGRSTDEEAMAALAAHHPIPAKLLEHRELSKLLSTYVLALLEKIDPRTGRVHSRFNQAGTATGRLSSADPNLQNIPIRSELGRKIRAAVRAEKGKVLLSADYSQIDLRVLAHLSQDEALCSAFRSGGDIHQATAAEVFGLAREAVDSEMRRRAKAVNFGIIYGQSAHGLSAELGIPRHEAAEFIKRYKERYPGITRWMAETIEAARKDGSVKTLLGRVRPLPDIQAKNFAVRSFSERVAVNTPIQGTSADIIKAAMVRIHERRPDAGLVLQVHDELVFELPEKNAAAFGKWVRAEMENAVPLSVPVVVDVKVGPDWNGMERVS